MCTLHLYFFSAKFIKNACTHIIRILLALYYKSLTSLSLFSIFIWREGGTQVKSAAGGEKRCTFLVSFFGFYFSSQYFSDTCYFSNHKKAIGRHFIFIMAIIIVVISNFYYVYAFYLFWREIM